jgi:hypothetical protein
MVLEPRLLEKHNAKPVHTGKKFRRSKKVSNNIRQFSAYYDGVIIAGITIFESEKW